MGWKKVKLNEVLKQYRVQHIVQDNVEYKQVSILNDGSVVLRGSKIGKEIGRKRQFIIDLNTYPDTLIFTRQLLLQGSIGIASKDVNECIVTENMPMFSIQVDEIDKDFLILFLKSEVFKSRIRKIELSGSAQKSIHERTFLDLEFYIPKIEEQKEIVGELLKLKSHSNSISSELTHQLDLIKQLRQAFLREAMQGKLLPLPSRSSGNGSDSNIETGHDLLTKIKAEKAQLIAEKKLKKEKELPPIAEEEIPFEIPAHWAWCRLGEICNTITKGSSPNWQGVQYVDSPEKGILFITSKNVDSFKIDLTKATYVEEKFNEIEPRSILKKGDLLTNIVGASIGRTALYELDELANINQAVCILRIEHNLINKQFLLNLMNSNFVIELMFKMQFAPGRANLSMGNVANFTIPLPPLHEQEQIVAKLAELMAFCDGLEQSIKESQGYNEQLLQQVLREALQGKDLVNE